MIYRLYRKVGSNLELGFYIETTERLSEEEPSKLRWLVAETFEPDLTQLTTNFPHRDVIEIGPRLSIETPFSSNAVSIARNMGVAGVARFERTRRYVLDGSGLGKEVLAEHLDRMTEEYYPLGITSFDTGTVPEAVKTVDIIGSGKDELRRQNKENGWGMDDRDIDYNHDLFVNVLKRNPTNVELLQLGNANSEHSRHWYFKGKIVIDGMPMERTLFEIVQAPLKAIATNDRSIIAFHDNAGAIKGFRTRVLLPSTPGALSGFRLADKLVHITCTAETHNHPTAVEPYHGAATGGGGEMRDDSAVGRGGLLGVGALGLFVGNLFIPGWEIPGEVVGRNKPSKYASPLEIYLKGSRGDFDYGNQIGRPVTFGFARTFGQTVDGEWREPRKPILYSAGTGRMFGEHTKKEKAEAGMLIVRIGGPAYPIGVGGGAASSMMQGANTEELDFNSVQRGNAEMENRTNRVICACVEMGEDNPISSIHDQGAGGPSNVLTELLEPLGGRIDIAKITLGDKTMSVAKIWSAEFQESYGLLIRPSKIDLFRSICERERTICDIVGEVDGSGKIVVVDSRDGSIPVDLNLEQILSNLPQKTFETSRRQKRLEPLNLPEVTVGESLEAVFKLPSVGSKSFLVHGVDRSVTGLVAQQQCCGIAQIPIANVSVNAQSHFGLTGAASAIGEQPVKMLIDPGAGARMAVGEMLTNIVSGGITSREDIRCRANWMWPAKLPHEGAQLYDAAVAMSDLMIRLGVAVDGGKDSLSMAATVSGETVKAPGSLVVLGYAPVPDITKKVTPDVKAPGASTFLLIDLGRGNNRLGGSALAQAFNQLGNESPDVDDPELLVRTFDLVHRLVKDGHIFALHDRSDGGLITTVAEMCMASRCGFSLELPRGADPLPFLFNEELGFIIEILSEEARTVSGFCHELDIPVMTIGESRSDEMCIITDQSGSELLQTSTGELRSQWEATSGRLEELQIGRPWAWEERHIYSDLHPRVSQFEALPYNLTFVPSDTPAELLGRANNPRVAILREEGTNGDREMAAACYAAGLAPFDITMSDLLSGRASLDDFRMVIPCGGFSYMDVCDSAKGWAGTILFNDQLREMFDRFYAREDTLSLGVCNGAQLMMLLGWVPWKGTNTAKQPRFIHNLSGRFESRWVQVKVLPSPSALLSNMEGSTLGIWIAHGEGRLIVPDEAMLHEMRESGLVPLAYVQSWGEVTETYPYNPNGSPFGITAVCSRDGRHLAMMPHPERCFRLWQWPWVPSFWLDLEASPWLRMFQNAREWLMGHRV